MVHLFEGSHCPSSLGQDLREGFSCKCECQPGILVYIVGKLEPTYGYPRYRYVVLNVGVFLPVSTLQGDVKIDQVPENMIQRDTHSCGNASTYLLTVGSPAAECSSRTLGGFGGALLRLTSPPIGCSAGTFNCAQLHHSLARLMAGTSTLAR